MNQDSTELTYYVINNVLSQLVVYVVPLLILICVAVWGVLSIKKHSRQQDRANTEIKSLLAEIKVLLENRKP